VGIPDFLGARCGEDAPATRVPQCSETRVSRAKETGKRAFLIGGPNAEVAERSAYAGDVTGAPGPLVSASGRADASREWSGRARRFPGGPI
jgi:hypothetical protein